MSFLTWSGAAIGCALANFEIYIVNVDFSALNNVKRPFFDFIKPVFANKSISGPLHNFACTLFGALLGLLTEMTYNVSFPSLFMFLLSSLITNRNKFFSLRSVHGESESEKDNLNTTAPFAPQTDALSEDLNREETLFLLRHEPTTTGNEGDFQVTNGSDEGDHQVTNERYTNGSDEGDHQVTNDTNITDEGSNVTDKEKDTDTNAEKGATRNLLRRRQ